MAVAVQPSVPQGPVDKTGAVQPEGAVGAGGGVTRRPYFGELAPAGVPANDIALDSDR